MYLKEFIFLRTERSDLECDVIGDDDDITTFWILRGHEGELPGHHADL